MYSDSKNIFQHRKLTVDLDRENSRPFLFVSYIYVRSAYTVVEEIGLTV